MKFSDYILEDNKILKLAKEIKKYEPEGKFQYEIIEPKDSDEKRLNIKGQDLKSVQEFYKILIKKTLKSAKILSIEVPNALPQIVVVFK